MSQIYQGQLLGHQERFKLARKIGERAKYKELIEFQYNSSTPSQSVTRDFQGFTEVPLSMCWYLGTLDADGTVEDDQATIVPNNSSAQCVSGLTASHSIDASGFSLDITLSGITGSNVRKAYFYYIAYYDAPFNPALVFSELSVQYIVPNGIASVAAFGTPTMVYEIEPTGIASAEAFGTATVVPPIAPSGDMILTQDGTGNILLQNGDDILLQ